MTAAKPDHRPAVATLRREKMRARLIEAALAVIAAKGIEGTVIEDVVAEAGVSRGSFYNHFPDIPSLMVAARDALVDELLHLALAAVQGIQDPAEACAKGMRVALTVTAEHPLLAQFTTRLGMNLFQRGNLVSTLLPPVLAQGMAAGRFCAMPLDLASDLFSACMMVALQHQAAGQLVDLTQLIAAPLRMLAVAPDEALRLAALPIPHPQTRPDGFIARSGRV